MKKILIIILFVFVHKSYCQDSIKVKTNPIIFGELILGYGGSFGEYSGFLYGGNGNFQFKKNLLTIRYTENPEFKYTAVSTGTVAFPAVSSKFKNTEKALLYGRRFEKSGRSLSFSAGLSINDFQTKYRDENDQIYKIINEHYGFAYELNIKWFKAKKEPYRIYAIIPVGEPTAFGRSFGFKLLGNISEHSYIGFAMSYGFGWHKYY